MKFHALIPYLTPPYRVLLLVLVLLLANSAAALAQPWLAGQLTGALLEGAGTGPETRRILLVWLLVLLLRALLGFASQYQSGATGESMTANLRSRLFAHLQGLPLGYFHQRRRGDVLALLSNDAEYVSSFVSDTLVRTLPLALTFAGALLLMALIDPVLTALAALLLPAYYLAMKIIGRSIRPMTRAWLEAYSAIVSFLGEHLEMVPAIKSFTREPAERERFEAHNAALLGLSRRQLLVQAALSPAVGLLAGLGLLLLLWLGGARIASGALEPGQLVSLLLYAMLLSQPLQGLANLYGQVQRTRGAAERILEFLAEQREPDDRGLPELPAVSGDIRFDGVHFRYPGGRAVLQGLDLHIDSGETIAITGPNGAGKSTLAHLLLRLAAPDAGRILVDGTDIANVSLASLRRQVGLVSQHTLLVNGTVAENIGYAHPFPERERIEQAARLAQAQEFINALPQGYETVIGDQGLRLSGGQRQRISLARTLLADPQVLILDEATSMFDPAGEQDFIRDCRETLGDKTVILITHRPASLALADRVIHLDHTA